MIVAPELYTAIGISGRHLTGMKDSKMTASFNNISGIFR